MNINYFKSALLHHSKGNWNKAKEIYEHILKIEPNNYPVLQNYGPLLCQLREYKLAKKIETPENFGSNPGENPGKNKPGAFFLSPWYS